MPFSRGSSLPRDRNCIFCIAGGFFTAEPPRKPHFSLYWSGKLILCLSSPFTVLTLLKSCYFVAWLSIRFCLWLFCDQTQVSILLGLSLESDAVFLIHPDISGRTHFHLSRVHFDYLIKAISARLCHIPVTLFLFVMNQYLLGKYFETRLVTTFLPRSKCLLNSWLQSPSTLILEPRKIKSATVSPYICHGVMDQMP